MAGSYISPPASNLFPAPPNFIDANQQTLIYCTVADAISIVHKLDKELRLTYIMHLSLHY